MRAIVPLLLLVPTVVFAQSRHNSAAPINFGADHIDLQDKANRAVLTGNVQVHQAEMDLTAQRMTIAYTGQLAGGGSPQATRLDAAGDVVVRRPDQTATSRFAVYDLTRRVITMLGAVTLRQANGNTVNGARLSLNLDTGRAVIDGAGVPGGGGAAAGVTRTAPSGRVTGTFSVPKREGQ